jgi:dihydrofolate reductase
MKSTISIIAAIGKNRELGKDNKLLWHIPEDLKRFRQLTSGHPIIMGRKTFESIGRCLPNRTNVIITKNSQFDPWKFNNCQTCEVFVAHSLEEAIERTSMYKNKNINVTGNVKSVTDENEIFVIGGGQIFEQAIKFADRLYLTIVHKSFDADTFFPDYSMFTKVIDRQDSQLGEYKYTFLILER